MLFLDLETFSELDLRKVALDRYSSHPSTRILMCAYALDDGPVQIWQEGEDKAELVRLITSHTCIPWNCSFERAVLARVWGVRAPKWIDAMIGARYAGFPSQLKECGKVPYFTGISVGHKETLLINKFCKPSKSGTVKDRTTDPEEWAAFCEYCKDDVRDTRMVYKWVKAHFDIPHSVYERWVLDQEINKRGMPIDLPYVFNANQEAERLVAIANEQLQKLTGLDNPNSPVQLLKWAQARGYVYPGLGKELVKKAVDELSDGELKEALQLRLNCAKSSLKKLPKILATIGPGNRLRDQYAFYKAHTGRFAGRGAQLQNLKAPRTKEEKALVAQVVAALEASCEVSTLDALSLGLRPAIKAPKGKKVVLADFKSVENRDLAWISGCEPMMDVYRKGQDPYIDFASRMENIPYEEVTAEMRQTAKPGTLGCGFGLGGGKLIRQARCKPCKEIWNVGLKDELAKCPKCGATVATNQVQKTGLWRYAEMMGIDLAQKDAEKQVEQFRLEFNDVVRFWEALENCFYSTAVTRRKETIVSSLGPSLTFYYRDPALRIVLPSGRELVYCSPYASRTRNKWGYPVITLGFDGCGRNGGWCRHNTYGGKLCENVVQAIAGDLLMDALVRVSQDPRFEIVGHTHDEIITLTDEGFTDAVPVLEGHMSEVEPWAKGLLMAADGYEGKRYAKG